MILVAVPTIQAFIDRSCIASALSTSRIIQEALATYSMNNMDRIYPERIADYGELAELVNQHGAFLRETAAEMGVKFRSYTGIDSDGDGTYENYTMSLAVSNVPTSRSGWCVVIEPSGIGRCNVE